MKKIELLGVNLVILVFLIGVTSAQADPYWAVEVHGGSGSSGYGECHGPACPDITSALDDEIIINGAPYVSGQISIAESYADLSTGKLGVYSFNSSANAMFLDTLRFSWEGYLTQQAQITIHVSGDYASGSWVNMNAHLDGDLSAYWGQPIGDNSTTLDNSISAPDFYLEVLGRDWTRTGYDTFTETFTLHKYDPTVVLFLQLMGDGCFDLLNSAEISLTLPEGVSFTSDSGAFLSQSSVPIPPAILLLGSGIMGLGLFRRKVKKQ